MSGNETLYFEYISGIEATLKISNAENVKVICDGEEYLAKDGKITVNFTDSTETFQIINTQENEVEISFTIE